MRNILIAGLILVNTIYGDGSYKIEPSQGQYIEYSTCITMKNTTNNPTQFVQDMRNAGYGMGCN